MPTTNLATFERQTKKFEDLVCCHHWQVDCNNNQFISRRSTIFSHLWHFWETVSSLLPFTKYLLFVHRPYRCLAATDLLVGIVSQPFIAIYWMSLAHEEWYLCRFAYKATYITAYALCSVSLLTMAVIIVDKLLALFSELRYRQLYCMVETFWVLLGVAGLCFILDYRIDMWCGRIIIPSCLIISAASYKKIFCVPNHH